MPIGSWPTSTSILLALLTKGNPMKTSETSGRLKARSMSTVDLLAVLAKPNIRHMLESDMADIELVGRWVWIFFVAKPTVQCRTFLKCVGFRFNRRRGLWQHSCGVRSIRSGGDPRQHYGSMPVNADDTLTAVA